MLEIDGSQGEGGGQVLRTSLALSLATGRAVRLTNIRANRSKPGLRHQHLAAVRAAAEIGSAELDGATFGSQSLVFRPGSVQAGSHRFDVTTAGSTTLVLQTVLPVLLCAEGPSTLVLEGGTHNPFAPPFEFLAATFLPLIGRLGPRVVATLERPGFYPHGGGKLHVSVEPAEKLAPLSPLVRGPILDERARAVVAGLPRHIAERELAVLARRLSLRPESLEVVEETRATGPGNVVLVEVTTGELAEVFTGFGRKGLPAETVAERTAKEVRAYLEADVPVGTHLADQLLLPLALGSGGVYRTLSPSRHARTNADVIRRFLPVRIDFLTESDGKTRVEIEPPDDGT